MWAAWSENRRQPQVICRRRRWYVWGVDCPEMSTCNSLIFTDILCPSDDWIHFPCKPSTYLNGVQLAHLEIRHGRCGLKWCWWICWAGWFWEGFVPRPGGKWIMEWIIFSRGSGRFQFLCELVGNPNDGPKFNGRIFPTNVVKMQCISKYMCCVYFYHCCIPLVCLR